MNKLSIVSFVALTAFSGARATSRVANPAADTIRSIPVVEVESRGVILRVNPKYRIAGSELDYLIGIPVKVNPETACTQFVGQESRQVDAERIHIDAKGATNPLMDACIALMPKAISTQLSVHFNVDLKNGTVETKTLILSGREYQVTLDATTQEVTIQ